MTAWLARTRTLILLLSCVWCSGCFPIGDGNLDEEKDPHFLEGKTRCNNMDFPGAIESFEKAISANPQSATAHFELGLIDYHNVNDYPGALYHFGKFLKLRPNAAHADTVRSFMMVSTQEIAKTVNLGPMTQQLPRELERLMTENARLHQQIESLQTQLAQRTTPVTPTVKTTISAPPNGAPPSLPPKLAPSPPMSQKTTSPNLLASGKSVAAATLPEVLHPIGALATHAVKSGETPFSIAKHYGVKLSALLAANPELDPKRLKIGQSIRIPGR